MRRSDLVLLALLAALLSALSRPASAQAPLERTEAFEQANAASFYRFDACGDGVAGRLYRSALLARFAQCPFSAEARARFRERSALQRKKSSDMINALIEANDGVPLKLEGMRMTCREQRASPGYREFRTRLERFASGAVSASDVIPEDCVVDALGPG